MVRYNMSFIDGQNDTTGMVREINSSFSGYPWIMILVILWIASYVYAINRNSSPDEAFMISAFFMSIIGSVSYLAGFISFEVVVIPIVCLIGMFIYIRFRS